MYCSKCGKEIKEGEEFCSNCGTSISAKWQGNIKQKNRNKSKLFFILTAIGTVITVMFIILHFYYSKEWDECWIGVDGYYGSNLALINYESGIMNKTEYMKIEEEEKALAEKMEFFCYAGFVVGGISIVLLIISIIFKVKEKGGIKIVD